MSKKFGKNLINANYNQEQRLWSPQKPNESGWITTITPTQFFLKTRNNLPSTYVNKKQWNTSDEWKETKDKHKTHNTKSTCDKWNKQQLKKKNNNDAREVTLHIVKTPIKCWHKRGWTLSQALFL